MPAAPVLSGVKTAAAVVSLSFSRQLIITPNCLWLPGVASSADIKTAASPSGSVFATACFHIATSYWANCTESHAEDLQSVGGVPAAPNPCTYWAILASALGLTLVRSLRSSVKRMACALRTPVWVSARVRICTPRIPRMPRAVMTIATRDSINAMPRWCFVLRCVVVMGVSRCMEWLLGEGCECVHPNSCRRRALRGGWWFCSVAPG